MSAAGLAAVALLAPGVDPARLVYAGSVAEARGARVRSLRLCQCGECHDFWWATKEDSGLVVAVVELPHGGLAELWHARPASFHGLPV